MNFGKQLITILILIILRRLNNEKIINSIIFIINIMWLSKKENIEKFYLNDSYYGSSEIRDIKADDLKSEDSFLLFTYNYYCSLAIPCDEIFKSFSKNENIEILSMSIDEFKKTSYYKTVKYAPSVLIIKDGKIVTFLDAEKNSDIEKYQDIDKFTEWVSKYIYLTKN